MSESKFLHLGLGWIGDCGGGLERYQDGICRAHAAMGYPVESWNQSRVPIGIDPGYQAFIYASPVDKRRFKLRRLRELAERRFRDRNFTFVSHHASVSSSLVKMLSETPHVIHFQGPWADESAIEGAPKWKSWLQRRIERRVYHSANRIITLSDAFKRLIVERYGVDEAKVHVIPGGIDTTAADPGVGRIEARERLGWPKDRPILLSVRRLVRRVGVDVLVDAVGQIRDRHPDLLTLIGGAGPLKGELERRISDNNLGNHVRLLGFIPDEQLPFAYAAADYSIVPTQGLEGFGLVTIESMAAGTPSFVTPVGSLPEIVTPLCKNLLLPGSDAHNIAEGVSQILGGLLKVPDADHCKRYVREYFDWSVIAPRVLGMYESASKFGQ
jgi:glycosyltransferase involved in cell wall biosynthesis